jgi:two-component system chemotaxis response regulator CheY
MPGIPGLDLCRRLSRDTQLSMIPVILLTSCEDPEVRQQGREAGARAFLTKPFSPTQLLDLVDEYTQ